MSRSLVVAEAASILILLLVFAGPARAQDGSCDVGSEEAVHGDLRGRVTAGVDGVPLPGAQVVVSWAGGERSTESDARGEFRVCRLPADTELRVRAAALGFTGPVHALRISEGEVTKRDLEVGFAGGKADTPGITPALRPGRPGRVAGRVRDAGSGDPVAGVWLGLERGGEAVTDAEGRFLLERVPPGSRTLGVRHVAYGRQSVTVEVPEDRTLELEIRLAVSPIDVEPIAVRVAGVRDRWLEARGFYERREWGERLGHGVFFARSDLEQRNASRLSHVLESVPGMKILRFCATGPCFRLPAVTGRVDLVGNAKGYRPCPAEVYVDGDRARLFSRRGGRLQVHDGLDRVIKPAEVAGMEIYRRASELPAEFSTLREGCGAVVLWTR